MSAMRTRPTRLLAAALAAGALGIWQPRPLAAQALDRSVRPAPGPLPTVQTPNVVKRSLPNGLQVWTVTQRELPTINASLVIRAGAVHDGDKAGLASMTASVLDEGTSRHSSLEFARAVDALGANLGAFASDERTTVTLSTLKKTGDQAFTLMGELVTQPAFAAEEIERDRKSRLQSLRQQKDQPTTIASNTFAAKVYGAGHPYGRPGNGTPESIGAITREDIAAFYGSLYRPNNAVLVIVGDVTADEAVALATKAFGSWEKGEVPASVAAIPPRPAARAAAVYLVDKPGAAQSEIRIGHPGAARSTNPDYYALQVLNTILGGQFSSRINLNLRESKGYTYGARSGWTFARGDGPFVASAGVFTAKTDSSLVEFLRELRDIRAGRPVTEEEVAFAKRTIVQGYPRALETNAGVVNQLADLAFFGLPEAEMTNFLTRVQAVKPADVTRVARRYLQPDQFTIVVVGDLSQIRSGIEALNLGPVTVLDADGMALK
ncbi:MAG: M16 family metallopeptidase [Gemmatimonadota bacterium]